MLAKVTYYNVITDEAQIEVNGHNIHSGGMPSGFCYTHQTFDCVDRLSGEEVIAMENAFSEQYWKPIES